ncbi:MAG: CHASE2 domain-containing protein [Acidobacteriota bacterium]|nr:CHASE2 domain-containing protein [Acidobacteriota bacterium]
MKIFDSYFWTGVTLSVLLTGLGMLFERTLFGEHIKTATYELLQERLTLADQGLRVDLPVTVIDISELARDDSGATPRNVLQWLITALGQYRPAAIGLDIDFSPEGGRFVKPEDPEFFEFCEKKTASGVPVYLGIWRSQTLPPKQWLVLEKYSNLAAALRVPRDARRSEQRIDSGRTMSRALADGYCLWHPCSEDWPTWILEPLSPIDYSLLKRIYDKRVAVSRADFQNEASLQKVIVENADAVRGKMVLVGDVKDASDTFNNPVGEDPIPGALIHASAAYTQAIRPLYEIRGLYRQLGDLLLAVILLLIVGVLRPWLNPERLSIVFSLVAASLAILVGLLVNHTGVFWDDFLLVAIALAVHPFVAKPFERGLDRFRNWITARNVEVSR